MCRTLEVSRSGYYSWINRVPSKRTIETQQLKIAIRELYHESKNRYGSPKIMKELRFQGWTISQPRVARMMSSEGFRSIITKKFRSANKETTPPSRIAENHLSRNFTAEGSGQKWVSDITYIPTNQGWLYLTIIMDLFDRKIIGWSLSTSMTAKATVLNAWNMAIKNRPTRGVLFHSDRGVQYSSDAFKKAINEHEVVQSMSRKGNCWDNAVAENFFKIIKSEMIYHQKYHSVFEAKNAVFEFIEIWYNRKRIHSYLDYKTPEEFGRINYAKCA